MRTSTSLLVGGSFDPVHVGHLLVARAAAEAAECNGVTLVPCAQSPHKAGLTNLTPAVHRLAMLRAAVTGNEFFDILTVELQRPTPSFTYDTVEQLFASGWTQVRWLIGADQVLALPKWHRAAELLQRVRWVIAARPGYEIDWEKLPEPYRKLQKSVVKVPQIEISSTVIRQRLANGLNIRYMLPPEVERYIEEHCLYRRSPYITNT